MHYQFNNTIRFHPTGKSTQFTRKSLSLGIFAYLLIFVYPNHFRPPIVSGWTYFSKLSIPDSFRL